MSFRLHPCLRTLPEPAENETNVQRIHESVTVLISGIAVRITFAHPATKPGEHEPGIERVYCPVAVGVALANGTTLIQQYGDVVLDSVRHGQVGVPISVQIADGHGTGTIPRVEEQFDAKQART